MDVDEDDSTEDDGDLDAPSRSQTQSQTQAGSRAAGPARQSTKSPSTKSPSEPINSPPPVTRPKAKGFRIGGKAKKDSPEISQEENITARQDDEEPQHSVLPPSHGGSQVDTSPKKPRKPFRIGGKHKASQDVASSQRNVTTSPTTSRFRDAHSPTPKSSPPPMPQMEAEATPVEEVHEETPEEKAERKRAELKRRNEEIAKKQAQHKKKKRF